MKRALKVIFVIAGIGLVLLLGAILYYVGVTAGVRLDADKLILDTACIRLYDGEGKRIDTATGSSVSLSALPDYLPKAFVAVEDKRFYSHGGLDFYRIGGAFLKNIGTFSFREGASTISQQLIKNTHLTSEKTINRKLKEVKLSRQLEKKYSKEEILELYINSIYFGHDAFGVSSAANFYFGKDAEELSPAESAMLAALVKSPNRYSPFRDAEKCLARRNFVLSLMNEQDLLTEEEYSQAILEPLPTKAGESGRTNAYLSIVFDELSQILPDVHSSELSALRVYTYYDPLMQAELEKTETETDVCLLVRDNKTDGLTALHSTCGTPKRLPASTLKPLLVYGPAIEEDFICPATPILDEKTDFAGYCPDDANGATGEYMSARYALSHSVNIPAVKILNTIGCERGVKYLEKMNLHVDESDYSLTLALGGMREGFTLPALADAYAAFAKNGLFSPSHTISRIEDGRGRTIYEFTPEKRRVFSDDTSYLVSDMLKTAATEGTARKLRTLPFPVCAKTGTAEGKGGNTDAYTIAYTSEHTVAVWMGNRDNSPVHATGGGLPANFTLDVLQTLYRDGAPADLPPCEGVELLAYDRQEYELNHRILLADPLAPVYTDGKELFKRSARPTEVCTRYTSPRIDRPQIFVSNGAVNIVLCQTKYYEYIVKRENRGEITTIYNGKYQKIICDNSVRAGESYRYTVIPVYGDRVGETVELPLIRIEKEYGSLPDNWWEE